MFTQSSFFHGASISWCNICGRRLTNPVSVARGIGPICAGKHGNGDGDMGNERPYDEYLDIPLTEGIVFKRENGTVYTNVPHYVTHHSPDGYEFGYGGSGPGDLALNTVEALLHHLDYAGPNSKAWKGECFTLAFALHQDFKWKFVCETDRDAGGVIPYQDAMDWIKEQMPTVLV